MLKQKTYWYCQLGGWFLYTLVNLVFFGLSYKTSLVDILNYVLWFPVGISITHFYRYIIIKFKTVKWNISFQIPFIIIASFILAILFFFLNIALEYCFDLITYKITFLNSSSTIINLTLVFVFWSVIYFGVHYIDNYKKVEIENLKWDALIKDVELNKLKSQLNPHFMFNSMNSIRALVDENPQKAKLAINQLSNILRNTLMMNKSKVISLEEELKIVKDYLELEHTRFEERLNYSFDIAQNTLNCSIPPLMVQTLVENGIKHGISKLTLGGRISVTTHVQNNYLHIIILNSGQLVTKKSETGFGIVNTQERLSILYGPEASISLFNLDNETVKAEIKLPINDNRL